MFTLFKQLIGFGSDDDYLLNTTDGSDNDILKEAFGDDSDDEQLSEEEADDSPLTNGLNGLVANGSAEDGVDDCQSKDVWIEDWNALQESVDKHDKPLLESDSNCCS